MKMRGCGSSGGWLGQYRCTRLASAIIASRLLWGSLIVAFLSKFFVLARAVGVVAAAAPRLARETATLRTGRLRGVDDLVHRLPAFRSSSSAMRSSANRSLVIASSS